LCRYTDQLFGYPFISLLTLTSALVLHGNRSKMITPQSMQKGGMPPYSPVAHHTLGGGSAGGIAPLPCSSSGGNTEKKCEVRQETNRLHFHEKRVQLLLQHPPKTAIIQKNGELFNHHIRKRPGAASIYIAGVWERERAINHLRVLQTA